MGSRNSASWRSLCAAMWRNLCQLPPNINILPGKRRDNKRDTAMAIDDKTRTELEAAVFRRLVEHLRSRADVQNIDLMNLAGFCRNCLSNWLKEEADARG